MADNTLPLPGLIYRATPTRHITSTRATDAVAKLRYAQHQAEVESRQLIAKLRDDANEAARAGEHRCIHAPLMLPVGDKPSIFQMVMLAVLIFGFAIAAVMTIRDGVIARHPVSVDGGAMATSVVE